MQEIRTLYALIDENSLSSEGEAPLVLDGVESASFALAPKTLFADEAGWEPETWMISLDWSAALAFLGEAARARFDESPWYAVTFELNATSDSNASLYPLQMLPEGPLERVSVTALAPLEDMRILNKLSRFARLHGAPRASKAQIKALFDNAVANIQEPMVVVYDVGQANWNALVDAGNCPNSPPKVHLFFDFGVPSGFNTATLPTPRLDPLSSPTAGSPAPVILSHWDLDHWAGAAGHQPLFGGPAKSKCGITINWDPRAVVDRTWLVPNQGRKASGQRVSPTAWRLALALHRNGNLMIWPHQMDSVQSSRGDWIVKCVPQPGVRRDNNNTGLAFSAMLCNVYGDYALCPGDAEYSSVFANVTTHMDVFHLVASHHGGNLVHPAYIPIAYEPRMSLMAVSHGAKYRHPAPQAMREHAHRHWGTPCETHTRRTLAGHTSGTVGLPYWRRPVNQATCQACAHRIDTCPV